MSEQRTTPLDSDSLREAFGCFPSGVAAVCALDGDEPIGLAASSFTSVSIDPPLVSVCVAHASTTWPVLSQRQRLGISVLADAHDDVCRDLAAIGVDRFAAVDWEATETGAVFVHGATAWFECSVDKVVEAGDHDIVVLSIHALEAYPDIAPLVFHTSRFRRLASGNASNG